MSIIKKFNNAYFKSLLLTLIMILIIFAVKNVYPFGNETISNADMGQAFLPAYYNLWDFFHGKTGLFFNYNVGAGTNVFDTTSVYGFSSPLNWIVALTSRDNIVNFVDYVLILKLLFISLTSSILFRKVFKNVSDNKIALFSMLYALSGHTMMYHTNISWLEAIGMFPLIILGLYNIVNKKGIKLYVISLTLSLIFSFYISYMSLLLTIFGMGIYLFINRHDNDLDIDKIIFELGIGTIFSFCLSAFINLPVIYQTIHSYRFGLSNVNSEKNSSYYILSKEALLCFYGMPFVYLIKNIFNYNKKNNQNKKKIILLLSLLFLTIIPIFLEKVNLMWHTGSYIAFPYRFAYIPIMLIYMGALMYLDTTKKNEKFIDSKIIKVIIAFLFIIIIYLYKKYSNISLDSKIPASLDCYISVNKYLLIICILSFITTFLITKISNKLLRKTLIILLVFIQVIASSAQYVGVSRSKLQKEHNDETIPYAMDIYHYGLDDKTNYKYKDYNNSIIENYPFISKKASLSTWHMIDENQMNTHKIFGYATHSAKLLDRGGNIFLDQLLGINRIFSEIELHDDFYKLIGTAGKYYIYEYNKTLPNGIIYNTSNYIKDFSNEDRVDIYNNIYNNLFNNDDIIFKRPEVIKNISDEIDSYEIKIEESSYLYFIADESIEIKVNGEKIIFPYLNSISNTEYNSKSGMVYLGEYDNEIVYIEIYKYNELKYEPEFILLDKNNYWNFVDNYKQDDITYKYSNDKLTIKLNNSGENKSLFIPITYNEGMTCKVNGKDTRVNRAIGNYISIDLQKGENEIIITFVPPYFKLGIIISIVSLILLIIIYRFILKNYKLKFIPKIAKYLFIFIWISAFIYIYIYAFFR